MDENEQGIIEPILNEGQHKRIIGVGFDESTPITSSSIPIVQHIDSDDLIYSRDIFYEWLHYSMMHDPMEEFQAYYANLFLPPTTLVRVDIFQNEDVILKKLKA